ncbi:hypothetical protein [Phytohabitans kaempferiae]|uniref:Uncharacterized protein n=1 Tax=Phytohabitans kaempferiae TaxID=1620943 RepID=A0ABV6MEP5_9ACTN
MSVQTMRLGSGRSARLASARERAEWPGSRRGRRPDACEEPK